MKRIGIILSMALTLCASPLSARANGCYYGGGCPSWYWGFIPLAFGVGAAIGSAFSSHTTYVYSQPAYAYPPPVYSYTYAPPVYTYSPAAPATTYAKAPPANVQPAVTTLPSQAPPSLPEQVAWVPRTAGAGHWVPDPEPYSYVPRKAAVATAVASTPAPQRISISGSPGNVPVYVVSR